MKKHFFAATVLVAFFAVVAANHKLTPSNMPVVHASQGYQQQEQVINCSSDDMRRHRCPADTRGGIQMIRQKSEAACVFNSTWGYDDRGIWVDRGCRADFVISQVRREEPGKPGGWNGWEKTYTIHCSSDDMRRTVCPAHTDDGVRLVSQHSEANCIFGKTWGYNRNAIWVDRGCRADFELGNAGWTGVQDTRNVVYCASDDMHRHACAINARGGGVVMLRQRSDADCIMGRTWGFDRHEIWVDRGCRADFEVQGGRR